MIATRFSTVGWAGCICAAALSFYLVSQTVAAKRAELSTVDRKIQSTQREIAQLETEISTRGGMAQIENWNSRVYGLQAPGAAQFVNSSVQLVAMADPQPLPLDPAISSPHGPVQQASLTVPAAPAQAGPDKPVAAVPVPVERPALRQATYVQPPIMGMAQGTATLQKTSYETLSDDTLDTEKAVPAKPAVTKPATEKPATHRTADAQKTESKASVEKKPKVSKVAEPKPARDVAKVAMAKLDDAKAAAKKPTPKTATRMTALDDHWLAEATAEPKGKRSHKERP